MNKINENGRSMIEMLGVLAIIGVLSVGGIMGYSKAMMRYKTNKMIEQITVGTANIKAFFSRQGNYYGLSDSILRKANLLPEDMWKGDDRDDGPYDAFGNYIWFSAEPYEDEAGNVASNKGMRIEMENVPEEACIELLTHDWTVLGKDVIGETDRINCSDSYCEAFLRFPISLDNAVKMCSAAADVPGITSWMHFYIDTGHYYDGNIESSVETLNSL